MMMRKYFLIPDDINFVCFSGTSLKYWDVFIPLYLTIPRSFIGISLYNSALS